MEYLDYFMNILLNIDDYLLQIVTDYRSWTYLILFLIIFCETGLVVTPFLPGDSLLFATGALAATGALNLWAVLGLLCLAAFLGDSVNYSIGRYFGQKILDKDYRFINQNHILKTQNFYAKHGGKTIIFARFVPIIRTFAPFVAGIGKMNYSQFIFYNLIGGIFWVVICIFAGYFFGNIPIVKDNFSVVVLTIIIISILPVIIEFIKHKRKNKNPESNML